jgi:hypothetical protein
MESSDDDEWMNDWVKSHLASSQGRKKKLGAEKELQKTSSQ